MTTTDPSIGGEELKLDMIHWGTRFAAAETEAAYEPWRHQRAIPFNRAGLWASVASWVFAFAVVVATTTHDAWTTRAEAVVLPALLAGVATTYHERLYRYMTPLTMAANMVAGWVAVGLVGPHIPAQVELAIVIVSGYFGFSILRIRPAQAAVAVASYSGASLQARARAGT